MNQKSRSEVVQVVPLFVGKRIVAIREMTRKELSAQGWDGPRACALVIVLDDGSMIFASRDDEGNSPGALFGVVGDVGVYVGVES